MCGLHIFLAAKNINCLLLGPTTSISFWAQIYFFLAVIILFDITKFSKWLNLIENTGKTCKSYTVVGALAYMFFFYLRNRYIGLDRQEEGWAVGKYTGKIIYSKIKI